MLLQAAGYGFRARGKSPRPGMTTHQLGAIDTAFPHSPYRRVRPWNERIARMKSIFRNAGQFTSEK